jgi:energy-coupling factor transport system ATP-binding protein
VCGSALSFDDFTFTYKAQAEPSLYHINLKIEQGEKVLILGPSGSGKSTLSHCINGLIPSAFAGKSTGALTIFGEDAGNLTVFDLSKKIGTVLQDTDGQFVGLSVAEDIAFAAENDCVPAAAMHRRVAEAAKLVNIETQLKKAPQDLSGGQKQRVSIAGVLIDEVELLLFDEPLANLDPATGKQAIELIDDLYTGGARGGGRKTIIIIEHRLEDVLHRRVDRIVLMEQGRIIADMPPSRMLASGLLAKAGIREPLYLSALRYAGCEITETAHLEAVSSITFAPQNLQTWNQSKPDTQLPPKGRTLLEIRDLCFGYGGGEMALDHITFSLEKGASAALAGRNGAGKSTLAKLICGFEKPLSGTILFNGEDMSSLSIKERAERIGYGMQNPNHMLSFPLIFDEVAFGLRSRKVPESEVRESVYRTLEICSLYPMRNWPVSALSFGQKKRLSIASILALGPSMLILDEPTAGQDFRNYARIMAFLEKLRCEQDITLLLITHDMHLMLEYAEKAIVLSDGKLIANDEPATVLSSDDIIEKASLKRTSLYDLALRAGIADPRSFIRRFILYERSLR